MCDKPAWMRTYVQLGEFDTGIRQVEDPLRECDTLDDSLGTSRMIINIALGKLYKVFR